MKDSSTCPICGLAETWRPVRDFEGLYEISSIGRARSLPKRRMCGYGKTRAIPPKILTRRRVILSAPDRERRHVLRRVLFLEHYATLPPGAAVVFIDGDRDHLCAANLAWEFPHLGYRSMHHKVERQRGSASDLQCVDCGGAAEDWSYSRSGYREVTSIKGVPYSLDPAEYDPRCRSCHRRYDEAGVHRERDAAGRWTGVA